MSLQLSSCVLFGSAAVLSVAALLMRRRRAANKPEVEGDAAVVVKRVALINCCPEGGRYPPMFKKLLDTVIESRDLAARVEWEVYEAAAHMALPGRTCVSPPRCAPAQPPPAAAPAWSSIRRPRCRSRVAARRCPPVRGVAPASPPVDGALTLRRSLAVRARSEWARFDAFLISGSVCGVYDDVRCAPACAWITALRRLAAELVADGRRVVGVCFGHQLLAEALGGRAERSPRGWELGPGSFTPTAAAATYLSRLAGSACPQSLTLNYAHGDWVPPAGVPPPLASMGGSSVSPVQGMWDPRHGRVLTFQGHPEFDAEAMRAGFERATRAGVVRWPEGVNEHRARATLGSPTSEMFVGLCIARFIGV